MALAAGVARGAMTGAGEVVAALRNISHRYRRAMALDGVSLDIPAGRMVALIGPDGVGKSTLLGLVAGSRRIQSGELSVLGGSMRAGVHRARVCPRIAYMPQGLGRNLYPDLTVKENIAFFARLFGQPPAERARRIAELLEATGLADFPDRAARNLSGGMRQKLGLCCALVHDPLFLVLDEPTTGVDPLSRRQFWELIERMRRRQPGMSVLVATAYMEEAERFDWLIAMDAGKLLATGSPAALKSQAGGGTLEETFIALLPESRRAGRHGLVIPPRPKSADGPVIVARDLTRRFGDFTAVDRVSFAIERGEIFGFLGSNGCGKTTTMKMLTGLLPPSEGEALVFGQAAEARDMAARRRVGYMSQSFSLYTELSVRQNLELHARLFHLPPAVATRRIEELVRRFGLAEHLDQDAHGLPLGIRQRLSLAVAIVHEPEILILDEPTSGVDPFARDSFWELLVDLSRNRGVTIFISTHFMNEAARCDRVALMDAGRVLAAGAPGAIVAERGVANLEEAFIDLLSETAGSRRAAGEGELTAPAAAPAPVEAPRRIFSLRRLGAYSIRETLELWRDPIRLGFALFGTALLMLVLGFGITTDVDSLSFAVLDRDQTPESRAYLEEFRGSRYFAEKPPLSDYAQLEDRMKSGSVQLALEVPPGFGRDLRAGRPTEVGAWIDGAMPFRAETIHGYLQGVHEQFLVDVARAAGAASDSLAPVKIEVRFRYNPEFESLRAMVPSTMALLLVLIPAILMAVGIVREKELGSIINLYVTPVTRLEFLIGKQIPYIAVSMVNFVMMTLMAIFIFDVPLRGSFPTLVLGTLVYVTATTSYGMLISAFTRTQIAALFGTAILTMLPAVQFSGMLTPVSSLTGSAALMGRLFPMAYFLRISVGTFTKALSAVELRGDLLTLAAFVPVLTLVSLVLLRRQQT